MPRPVSFYSHRCSKFYEQLSAAENTYGFPTVVNHLKSSVDKVAEEAVGISLKVHRYMPRFTLHNDVHFLNVLWIMEKLVPDEVMERLHPLECALVIMVAYVHDLGMALSQEEYDKINCGNDVDYTVWENQFRSSRHSLDRKLREIDGNSSFRPEAEVIRSFLLETYLRTTHGKRKRIEGWLTNIAHNGNHGIFKCQPVDFKEELIALCMSHGEDACWLRKDCQIFKENNIFEMVLEGTVNWSFPSLLLRLGDILDLDWTRAPVALFEKTWIENLETPEGDIRNSFLYSWKEWEKHRSVTGWEIKQNGNRAVIRWEARCSYPEVHNSFLEYKGWINEELRSVISEMQEQRNFLQNVNDWRYDLHLPDVVDFKVRPIIVNGEPAYVVGHNGMAVVSSTPPESCGGKTITITAVDSIEKESADIRQVVGELKRLQVWEMQNVFDRIARCQKG